VKTATEKREFVIEFKQKPGFILTLSLSARKEMLDVLDAAGITGIELGNWIHAKLDECQNALDGSVAGLIISNLEE
jgi:hypothetical protein